MALVRQIGAIRVLSISALSAERGGYPLAVIRYRGKTVGWIIYNHHRDTEFTENIFLFTHREVPMGEKQSVLFL